MKVKSTLSFWKKSRMCFAFMGKLFFLVGEVVGFSFLSLFFPARYPLKEKLSNEMWKHAHRILDVLNDEMKFDAFVFCFFFCVFFGSLLFKLNTNRDEWKWFFCKKWIFSQGVLPWNREPKEGKNWRNEELLGKGRYLESNYFGEFSVFVKSIL